MQIPKVVAPFPGQLPKSMFLATDADHEDHSDRHWVAGRTELCGTRFGSRHKPGEDRWNPQHISGLPAEVRGALVRLCGGAIRAEHSFAGYFQGTILLHFEHLRCGERGALCTTSGCLHQVYGTTGGRYRLLRTYYGPESD